MVQYYGGICVVEATGHVACWGDGTYGTIGNNRYDSAENPTRAFYFGPDKKAVKVESSQRSVCAQTEAGEVWCWGQNTYGMLGVGSDEWAENTPIKVEFPDDQLHALDLVGAGEGYCAHLSDGSVHCWGGNYYGLLARGTNTETSNVPVLVFDQNRGVSQIGGTTPGMCAVLSNNTMWCWSEGLYGWDDPVDAPAQKWSNALLGKADAVLSGWGITTCLLAHEDGMWCYGDHQFVDADFNRTLPTPLIAFPGGETVLLPNQDTDEDGIGDTTDADDDKMGAMYQQCDVFILPNRTIGGDIEGFGMVLLEAQACGKYVVAGNSGGTKETMRVGETGYVIDCSSPDAIVEGFSMVMQKLPGLTMSPSEFVRSTFSWDVHVEKAKALFDRFAN